MTQQDRVHVRHVQMQDIRIGMVEIVFVIARLDMHIQTQEQLQFQAVQHVKQDIMQTVEIIVVALHVLQVLISHTQVSQFVRPVELINTINLQDPVHHRIVLHALQTAQQTTNLDNQAVAATRRGTIAHLIESLGVFHVDFIFILPINIQGQTPLMHIHMLAMTINYQPCQLMTIIITKLKLTKIEVFSYMLRQQS